MKRIILPAILLLGSVGVANAQGPEDVTALLGNLSGATNNLVIGLQATGTSGLLGDVSTTAVNFSNTLTGFAVDLSQGTPGEALAVSGQDLANTLVPLGQPLYTLLDGPAMELSALGAPVRDPLIALINTDFPALPDLAALASLGDGGLPGLDSLPIPGLDGLPLPLDALDPSTLTGLLDGAALPGL